MESNKEFTNGLYFNEPQGNAPDFVVGSLNVRRNEFIKWLQDHHSDESEYTRIAIKRAKSGKVYCELDTWVKTAERGSQSVTEGGIDDIGYTEADIEAELNPSDQPF